jgi:hypothetical protein
MNPRRPLYVICISPACRVVKLDAETWLVQETGPYEDWYDDAFRILSANDLESDEPDLWGDREAIRTAELIHEQDLARERELAGPVLKIPF